MSDIRELELTPFGTTTLGALIEALRSCNGTATVQYDFGYLAPADLCSYRGWYDHLAIGWVANPSPPYWPTVTELIGRLEAADGKWFDGWKGGEYLMTLKTPIMVDNRGEASHTCIVGIIESDTQVVIVTRHVP